MLLLDKNKRRFSARKILLWLLSGSLILFLGYLLITQRSGVDNNNAAIFCDAETVKDQKFVTSEGLLLGGGEKQSEDFAFSGQYSCRLPKADGMQFGFSYKLYNVEPEGVYRLSVWRRKGKGTGGSFLVISGPKSTGFYLNSSGGVKEESKGWELLEMQAQVPGDYEGDYLNFYIYSEGKAPVYFDDMKIKRLDSEIAFPDFSPRKMELEIKDQAYRKLVRKRDEAYEIGLLRTNDDSWVKGLLREGKEEFPVSLRLKGDWLDHLQGDKWSFRFKVKDPFAWNRLKAFSMHTPEARFFALEWLLHQLWEREDVLTTRYDFVDLRFNGKALGIYAYEEHFDKQLLEYRSRREGPIIRMTEEALWEARIRQVQGTGLSNIDLPAIAEMVNSDIEPFKGKRTLNSPNLKAQFDIAQNLLYEYQQGSKAASEIFDLTRTARYYAITDVMGAHHGVFWHNQRFYYNPVLSRLEPIGYDGFSNRPWNYKLFSIAKTRIEDGNVGELGAIRKLFEDEEFIREYMKHLYKYSSPEYMGAFLDESWNGMKGRLDYLRLEFPKLRITKAEILNRSKKIQEKLLPYNNHSVEASWSPHPKLGQQLQLSNLHELPLEVVGFGRNAKRLRDSLEQSLALPAYYLGDPRAYRFVKAPLDSRYVFYKPFGLDTIYSTTIRPWGPKDGQLLKADHFNPKLLKCSLPLEKEGQRLRLRKGEYTLDQDWLIPEGYELYIDAGTSIDIVGGAKVLSRSPVRLLGNSEEPVLISSSDDSAQGFTVLQAGGPSSLDYCIFKDLNTLNKDGWTLTGAVTFYESDVVIRNCVIRDNHCEDALNIIRSEFEADALLIQNTPFDGFDADFCKGTIVNSNFIDIGNDGTDFSGSRIQVKHCNYVRCGDKGLSVGEESNVFADQIRIDGATIGAAAKDLSHLFIESISLKDCNQGFAAYQKKAEYGHSKMVVESYQAKNVRYLHTIAPRCILELKGHPIVGK
ncbi:MAG: right-handed parallel beta-helix repeat-containing protein [Bacteroidota bacterium]